MSMIEAMLDAIAKDNGAVNELLTSIPTNGDTKVEVHNKLVALMRNYNKPKYLDENVLYLRECCESCDFNNQGFCKSFNKKLDDSATASNSGHYINNTEVWKRECSYKSKEERK